MAIQVNGTTVIDNSRNLTNISSIDATTAAAIGAAGVGAGTSVATSSSASPTFNASSDNVFIHTGLTSSTSVTFSNLPTEKEWTYWYNSGADGNAFYIDSIVSDGVSNFHSAASSLVTSRDSFLSYGDFNTGTSYRSVIGTGQGTNANYVHAMMLSEDGTKMALHWAAYSSAYGVSIFNLSTPYDLNSATHSQFVNPAYGANIASYTSMPHINQNGRGFLYAGEGISGGSGSSLYWQQLSTAWDLNSRQSGQTFNVGKSIYQVSMSANGQYVFYVDGSSNFYRRTLSTPYNLSTAGSELTVNPPSGAGYVTYSNSQPYFSKDGSKFSYKDGYQIQYYDLTTPFDPRTIDTGSRRTTSLSQSTSYHSITAGGILFARDNNNGHRLLDIRSGFKPTFSQVANAVSQPAPSTWNKVSFMTPNGGTDIYATENKTGVKG